MTGAAICLGCGTQFTDAPSAPSRCPICEDEHQYVAWQGQALDHPRASQMRGYL